MFAHAISPAEACAGHWGRIAPDMPRPWSVNYMHLRDGRKMSDSGTERVTKSIINPFSLRAP